MKYAVAAFAVFMSFGAGGYFYWISTPEYSLNQIKVSIQDKNKALFESHVDVKRITGSVVDEVVQMTVSDSTKNKNGWAAVGGMFAAKMIESMKPQFEGMVEKEISKLFETNREVASKKVNNPLKELTNVREQLSFTGFEKKTCSDQICYFELSFQHNLTRSNAVLTAKMEKLNGSWKLVELPSFIESLKKIKS